MGTGEPGRTKSCIDHRIKDIGGDLWLLCQQWVDAAFDRGDSGGPVFKPQGGANNVRLYGIIWGGKDDFATYFFSHIWHIHFELRSFETQCGPSCGEFE